MSEIRFDGPPPAPKTGTSTATRHAKAADTLRDRVGEWAVIDVSDRAPIAHSMASAIRTARLRPYAPAGSFEAVSRKVDDEFRVYARYVGTGEGGAR